MATYRTPILGASTYPETTGSVYFDYYPNIATNDIFKHGVWVFATPSADESLFGVFNVPKNYIGNAKIIAVWSSTATSGTLGVEFAYRAVGGNDSESLDQATVQETVNTTDSAPTAANNRMEVEVSLTSANLAADDTIEFRFTRDDSADSIAAAIYVVQLLFQYTDV